MEAPSGKVNTTPHQRQSKKGRQRNNRHPAEVFCWRAPLHHPPRDRRDKEAERSERRPDQTVTGGRQIDQPEVRARERQEQSDHRVEEHACKNHEECERRVGNPRSRSQHSLDRGFLRRLRSVICDRGVTGRLPVWLPHTEGDNERERGRDEVKINWKTQSRALGRGIGSALWWSAVTMTTVGYGDLAPRSPAGRLVAIAWMFVSLLLVSWFTASMASILTAERLDAGTGGLVVRGPDDLRHLHVGVIRRYLQ
jgi:Ion channel